VIIDETQPQISIKLYGDYSSKYGLGYILTNLSIGVYFNDGTKMLMEPNTECMVNYLYKETNDAGKKYEVRESYNVDNFPPRMRKKCLLFKYFRTYLKNK